MLNLNKKKFQTPLTGKRSVDSTIINRAYYSAYSYAYLWLVEKYGFKPKQKWEFEEKGENYISEHKQVRNYLKKYNSQNSFRLLNVDSYQYVIFLMSGSYKKRL